MLNKEIARASKEAARQRRRNTLTILGGVGSVIFFLISLSFIDFSEQPEPQQPSIPVQQTIYEPSPSVGTAPVSRTQFKEQLRHYEEGIEPRLDTLNWEASASGSQNDLLVLKEQALTAFSSGDYDLALGNLNHAQSLAETVLEERQMRFQQAFLQAEAHFTELSYEKAKLKIEKALFFWPDEEQALTLQIRIEKLPQIKELLEEIGVAQVENNLQKEVNLIRQLIVLDPERLELVPHLEKLERELDESRFAAHIDEGIRQVGKWNLAGARSSLAAARKIYPNRNEVTLLSNKVSGLRKDLLLKRALADLKVSVASDDWHRVEIVAGEALKVHPTNQILVDRYKLARRVVSAMQSIESFVSSPGRLSSVNVAQLAHQAIAEAAVLTRQSPSLLNQSRELERLLVTYNKEVDVFVASDNKTTIFVKGVGKIGLTLGYTIKLKPGEYLFEGRRKGFRSTLVRVQIPVGETSVTVKVICNERI
ncbi:MAG: hypothetical protein DRQ61_07385 [Gammaproteobacteria bacterium]|nr:MAG: hypothetical protein DRQ61_07385 [Gammaproteobacteria bacterium]